MKQLNMVITGADGRMGRHLIEAALADTRIRLHAALSRSGSLACGQDAGLALGQQTGVSIGNDIDTALSGADVLIDFTQPEGTLAYLEACATQGVNMVIGTTGFDTAGKRAIEQAARHIGIVFAPNFSVGVNLTFKLLDIAARVLAEGYDIEIIEAHHRNKVDAPSGTALRMGEVVAQALDRDLAHCAVYDRQGITGIRDPSSIGFTTVRGGDIVGEHTVLFATLGERIEISHKAGSRATFAQGAVRAASWLAEQQRGLFSMQDVLNLH